MHAWVTVGWCAVLLSCLVAMMAVFMGSGSSDLDALLMVQLMAGPAAAASMAFDFAWASLRARGKAALWRHIPAWLVFIVLAANSLVLIAELSFFLIGYLAEEPRPWREHVPAIAAFFSSIALAVSYAALQVARIPAAATPSQAANDA